MKKINYKKSFFCVLIGIFLFLFLIITFSQISVKRLDSGEETSSGWAFLLTKIKFWKNIFLFSPWKDDKGFNYKFQSDDNYSNVNFKSWNLFWIKWDLGEVFRNGKDLKVFQMIAFLVFFPLPGLFFLMFIYFLLLKRRGKKLGKHVGQSNLDEEEKETTYPNKQNEVSEITSQENQKDHFDKLT